jgi:HK97 family phage prohead protease
MEMKRHLLPTTTELLPVTKDAANADVRPVRVIVSTAGVDRMGDVIVQEGIDLAAYRRNPIVLWGHDPNCPVARAPDIGIVNGKTQATALFPAEGADEDADYVYGKLKAGIVNAASIGFNPIEWEAIDPRQPWGGQKFTKSELLEFSFVSIPANKDCVVIGRNIYVREQSALGLARQVNPQTKTRTNFSKGPSVPAVAQNTERLNEIMRAIGRPPVASPDGRLLSDKERRAWRVAERSREVGAELLDIPRYAHLRRAPFEHRLFEIRAGISKYERGKS